MGITPTSNFALGYSLIGTQLQRQPFWPSGTPWDATGILRSSVKDLLNYLAAQLGETTISGNPVPTEITQSMQALQQPLSSVPAPYMLPSLGTFYQALPWVVRLQNPSTNTAQVIGKNGETAGFSSWMSISPEKNLGVVILTNTANFDGFEYDNLLNTLGVNLTQNLPME